MLHKYFNNELQLAWDDEEVGYSSSDKPSMPTFGVFNVTTKPWSCKSKISYIYGTVFLETTGTDNGGAISMSLEGAKMLVELCTFLKCSVSKEYLNGGAIYQDVGTCVINKCCGIYCSTEKRGNGQFLYASLLKSTGNKLLDSSISLSYDPEKIDETNYYSVDLNDGTMTAKFNNISNNICYSYYIIMLSHGSTILFTSIKNNTAYRGGIFYITGYSSSESRIENCNIINKTGLFRAVTADDRTYISNCCILQNDVESYFGNHITIYNCTIEEESIAKINGNDITTEGWEPVQSSFIIPIKCTEKMNICRASYDSIGTLLPNIPDDSNDQTNIKKQPIITCDFSFLIIFHMIITFETILFVIS